MHIAAKKYIGFYFFYRFFQNLSEKCSDKLKCLIKTIFGFTIYETIMKQWSYFVLTAVIKEKTTESSNTICRKGLLHRCVSFLNILKSFKTTRLIKQ